jgi:hypothetical protein
MSWLKSASSSFFGALGMTPAPSRAELSERTEEIRHAMVSVLGDNGVAIYPALRRRLMCATDAEAIWYLRSEWMAALSTLHGERVAAAHLRSINIQFEGLLKKGMTSRPSPLSSDR